MKREGSEEVSYKLEFNEITERNLTKPIANASLNHRFYSIVI